MAGEVGIGPYVLVEDTRGLRIRRASPTGGDFRAALMLSVVQQNGAEDYISIRRFTPIDELTVEIHGFSTDRVAFDARLIYRPELDGLELHLELVNSTEDMNMRFGMSLELTGEADPEWMIPGFFYNENRLRECERVYPSYSEIQRDPEKFISNHWSFRSDRAAMPAVICQTHHVVGFLAGEETPGADENRPAGFGTSAIGFSAEDGFPLLTFQVPYVEEPVKYSFCHDDRSRAESTFHCLEKNEVFSAVVRFGFCPAAARNRESIYRALYQEYWQLNPVRPKLSSAESERLSVEGLRRWHLSEKSSMIYESAAFDRHFGQKGTNVDRHQMHVGWLSGVFPAYVLLWHGRDITEQTYVRAAHMVLDRITRDLAPCGTLYPVIAEDEGPMAGFGPDQSLAHSRTIAEAIHYLIRAHRLEMQANTTHQQWVSAIMSTLNFILKKQRPDGAFPDYWYLDDGDVYGYNGAAGMSWIAPLAACSHMVASTAFREAAVKAGDYYAQFVESGMIYGSTEDQPLVPTCEDYHAAVVAYMALYELDRAQKWFDLARKAADLALTWRMSYNVNFSPWSALGQAQLATRGGDICSVATPVLGCFGLASYCEMKKIAALSGDQYYEHRAHEARTFATQLLARVDGEFNARRGMAIGQLFHTDWWQPKGMVLTLSTAWTAALIEYAELIERNLNIPTAALEGDAKGIAEATLRAAVTMERDIVLPDPAELRRQKEAAMRRGRETSITPSGHLAAGKVEQFAPQSLKRRTGNTPVPEDIAPASFGILPPRAKTRPASRAEDVEHDTNNIQIPRKEFPRQPTPVPPEQKFFPFGIPSEPSEAVANLKADRRPASQFDVEKQRRSASQTEIELPKRPATHFDDGQQKRPPTQFGEKPKERPDTPFEFTSPKREEPRKKSPLGTRHVPLSAEERFGSGEQFESLRPAEIKTAQIPPLPEPPPQLDGGLLADLMREDTRPRFTPLADLPDHPDFPTSKPEPEEEETTREKTDKIEIKWKIF